MCLFSDWLRIFRGSTARGGVIPALCRNSKLSHSVLVACFVCTRLEENRPHASFPEQTHSRHTGFRRSINGVLLIITVWIAGSLTLGSRVVVVSLLRVPSFCDCSQPHLGLSPCAPTSPLHPFSRHAAKLSQHEQSQFHSYAYAHTTQLIIRGNILCTSGVLKVDSRDPLGSFRNPCAGLN